MPSVHLIPTAPFRSFVKCSQSLPTRSKYLGHVVPAASRRRLGGELLLLDALHGYNRLGISRGVPHLLVGLLGFAHSVVGVAMIGSPLDLNSYIHLICTARELLGDRYIGIRSEDNVHSPASVLDDEGGLSLAREVRLDDLVYGKEDPAVAALPMPFRQPPPNCAPNVRRGAGRGPHASLMVTAW